MHAADAPLTVVDFLSECAFDLQAGRLQPLRHYLARYAGHTEAIAREYLALVDDTSPARTPSRRLGRYELLRELGKGGQGRVHLARDPVLGRFVAVKVLELTGATDGARRARFRREIDSVLRLDHPLVCRVFEANLDHDPPHAAMELVPGRTLAELLGLGHRAAAAAGGLIAPRGSGQRQRFLRFFEQVARAIHAVHTAGIVHRDVKPANLMVTPNGEPRVLDFGLASPAERMRDITVTEAMLGTLPYMAPEQLTPGGTVDRRTDLFALGVTMLECWTRERPFPGMAPTPRLAAIQAGVPWRLLRRLPADLRAILAKALAAEPAQRYQTGFELADELQRAAEHRAVLARPARRLVAAQRWTRRHPWLTVWFAVMGLLIVLASLAANAARQVLASSRRLEASALDAVRSFDPWHATSGDRTTHALVRLLPHYSTAEQGELKVAQLHLRRGDVDDAREELAAAAGTGGRAGAALQLACDLLGASDEVTPPEAAHFAERLAECMPEFTDLLGDLCRCGCWQHLDQLTERALQHLAAPQWLHPRWRSPLRCIQLQAAGVRGQFVQPLGAFQRECALLDERHGPGAAETAEFIASYLRLAARVVGHAGTLDALRAYARNFVQLLSAKDPARAERLELVALGVLWQPPANDIARLEELHTLTLQQLGPGHRDSIEATWLLARQLVGFAPARACELLATAWQGAAQLPEAAEAELRANVARDHVRWPPPAMDPSALATVGHDTVRLHFRLWGPADPRTVAALWALRVDAKDAATVGDWLEHGLASLEHLPARSNDRETLLLRMLTVDEVLGRRLAREEHALLLQRSRDALSSGSGRQGRAPLARSWVADHDDLSGEDMLAPLAASVADWRRCLQGHDPGEGFHAEMMIAVGIELSGRGWLADAQVMLQQAVRALARDLGSPLRDGWLATAEALPSPHARTRPLLEALADLAEQLGNDDERIRLRRALVAPPGLLDTINGVNLVQPLRLLDLALAQVQAGRFEDAETTLRSALDHLSTRPAADPEVRRARDLMAVLFEVTERPESAAEQRRLRGR